MENNWWHEDHEEEGVRWFEIEEDELMDAILDYELMFVELGLSGDRIDKDDLIDTWLKSVIKWN